VSTLGSQMSRVAMPLLVLGLTNSPGATGLVGLIGSLPALLFTLPLGALVDRWNRRAVMLFSSVALALSTASIGASLLAGMLTLPQILVCGLVASTSSVAFGAAESASIPRVVSPDQINAAVAQNEAVTRSSQLIGPLIGGSLFGVARALPFFADAVSFGALIIALLGLRTSLAAGSRSVNRRLRMEIWDGVSWVRHQPFVRTTLLLTAGSNLLLNALYLLVVVIARNNHTPPAGVGLIFSIEALGAIGGTLLAPALARWLSLTRTVVWSYWIWAALIPLYLVSHNVVALGLVTGAIFSVSPIRNVILISYQMRIIPDELRGRVGSVAGLVTAGPLPFGSAAAGLLLQYGGTTTTISVLLVAMLVLVGVATSSRSIRQAP
jgi:MFS family permease